MEYLPLSYLNQLTYCPRRFWYMYIHGEIAINAPMLEGTLQHQRADTPGTETDDKGRTIRRHIWVWSETLNIAGIADFIESENPNSKSTNPKPLTPVEYKRGKKGKWDNDQIQLCAQALCLEEMTGQPITSGEIFYWRSRRRITIPIDPPLRQLTKKTIHHAQTLIASNTIPAPITEHQKCKHCSIQPICLPKEVIQLT